MAIPRVEERRPGAVVPVAGNIEQAPLPTKVVPVVQIEVAYPGEHIQETLWTEKGDKYEWYSVGEERWMRVFRGTFVISFNLSKANWFSVDEHMATVVDAYEPTSTAPTAAKAAHRSSPDSL